MTPKKIDCGNLDECIKIFISWQWGAGIIITFISLIIAISYSNAVESTNIKRDIKEVKQTISTLEKIDSKIDSLLRK